MFKSSCIIMLTGSLLLAGCGSSAFASDLSQETAETALQSAEAPSEQAVEQRASSDEASLTTAIWESIRTPGYTNTRACSGTAGSPCGTPGEVCPWFSSNASSWSDAYTISLACRPVNGTYREIEYVYGYCPSSQTNCPAGNAPYGSLAGLPCGHKGSYCIRQCYPSGGTMSRAYCE